MSDTGVSGGKECVTARVGALSVDKRHAYFHDYSETNLANNNT